VLLNIDKPRRSGTLHSDDCPMLPVPVGTDLKPIGALGRDGGWFIVSTESEARRLLDEELHSASFIRCQNC
jgi:hypothetical protein